jgi:excisionase family DNA binding protein
MITVKLFGGKFMLWTVKEAASFLNLEPHQVYYLLGMGEIEACKIGGVWRVVPESVQAYKARLAA